MALLPDLSVGGSLDVEERHLQHRLGELPLPPPTDQGVLGHLLRRLRRVEKGRIGLEQHLVM